MIVKAIVPVLVAVFVAVLRVAGLYGSVIAHWHTARKRISGKLLGREAERGPGRPLAADPFPEMTPEQVTEWMACLQGGHLERRIIQCELRGHTWNHGMLYCDHCGMPMDPLAAAGYALAADDGDLLHYAENAEYRQLCRDRARIIIKAHHQAVQLAGASPVNAQPGHPSGPASGTPYEAAVLRLIAGSVTLTDHERRTIALLLVVLGEIAESGGLDQVLEQAFWNAIEALRVETLDMALLGHTANGSPPAGRPTSNGTQHRPPHAESDQRPET